MNECMCIWMDAWMDAWIGNGMANGLMVGGGCQDGWMDKCDG